MKRYLWAVIISLLCVVGLHAQSTTVSGTVTDAGSQTWNNGSYQFNFVAVANYNGPYTWTGGAFNPITTINGTLNGSGHYSVSVPDNATISPSGSSWNLTVCPQGTGVCYSTGPKVITGGTQTLNAAPPAISVPPGPNSSVYTTSEIANGQLGNLAYVIGTGVEVCSAVTSGSCTTWTTVGGGGGTTTKVCSQVAVVMPTAAILTQAESTTATGTCTGLTTSDSIVCTSSVHLSGVTGFVPATTGILTILVWPTTNTINASYENNTAGTITPGALTINCGVFR
jgi:hypothetical protein